MSHKFFKIIPYILLLFALSAGLFFLFISEINIFIKIISFLIYLVFISNIIVKIILLWLKKI